VQTKSSRSGPITSQGLGRLYSRPNLKRYMPSYALSLVVLSCLFVSPVFGCLADPRQTLAKYSEKKIEDSDIVFLGKVTSIQDEGRGFQRLHFDLQALIKGPEVVSVDVLYQSQLSCSIRGISRGQLYYVYGRFTDVSDTIRSQNLLPKWAAEEYGAKFGTAYNK
jgi:hypothetical protein